MPRSLSALLAPTAASTVPMACDGSGWGGGAASGDAETSLTVKVGGNSDPLGVAISKSVESKAKKAEMDTNGYNLTFPSRTESDPAV